MSTILNLTRHPATPEQREAGVVDLPEYLQEQLVKVIEFKQIPSKQELLTRSIRVLDIIHRAYENESFPVGREVMIGGAPYFMPVLETTLRAVGLKPIYAFSRRQSIDQVQPDGKVKKVTIFRHDGFVKIR
jgi:hypothetical protein